MLVMNMQEKNNENNDKKDNTKKAVTIRINEQINQAFDTKLEQIYHKKEHKQKGNTIEILMQQFTKQDTNALIDYLNNNKTIIDLSIFAENQNYLEKINDYEIQIKNLEIQLKDKDAEISTLAESFEKKYFDEIQSLKNQINLLEQSIQEKEKNNDDRDKTISEKDKTIDASNEIIQALQKEKEQALKDVKSARNDYKHIVERLNKNQDELNDALSENSQYKILLAEIDKMSLLERIKKQFPKRYLELKP